MQLSQNLFRKFLSKFGRLCVGYFVFVYSALSNRDYACVYCFYISIFKRFHIRVVESMFSCLGLIAKSKWMFWKLCDYVQDGLIV